MILLRSVCETMQLARGGRAARLEAWQGVGRPGRRNETHLRLIKETAASRGVKATIQLDVIRFIEYLWRALVLSEEGTVEAEAWVTERPLEI